MIKFCDDTSEAAGSVIPWHVLFLEPHNIANFHFASLINSKYSALQNVFLRKGFSVQ